MADEPNKPTLSERIQHVLDWIKRVVTKPREELTLWQKRARFAYDLGRYGAKQLDEDNATQMAAALTFRTLFALFPIVVVSTVLFQGLRGVDRFHELVGDIVEAAGLDEVYVVPLEDAPAAEEGQVVSLGQWVQQFVVQIGDINLETLGWIGLAVLIYAAIAMMATIEDTFNTIYRAPEGRSWLRRVPIYWTVLTVGPIAIGLIFFIDARFAAWVATIEVGEWLVRVAGAAWGIVIIWLMVLGLYILVPNTRVAWRAAMVGALITAVLIQLGRWFLGEYIATFLTARQLYGTIGLVPLLMLWVYVMWLVVLFGLEVSATIQNLRGRRIAEMEQKRQRSHILDPASILLVTEIVAERFVDGMPATMRGIADATAIPETTVAELVNRLQHANILYRVESELGGGVTLARPPEKISADELMEIGYQIVDDSRSPQKSALLQRLRDAQKAFVSHASLASLIDRPNGETAENAKFKSEKSVGR